jgi:hypothetical protein
METDKVCFRDLNGWLKFLVIMGWVQLIQWLIFFVWGFIVGWNAA